MYVIINKYAAKHWHIQNVKSAAVFFAAISVTAVKFCDILLLSVQVVTP